MFLARIALQYHQVPTQLSDDQIEQYLFEARAGDRTPSETFFKLTVFSLRFAFKVQGCPERSVVLPKIARDKKLPVVLSSGEVQRLIESCQNPKHRLILQLLYGTGLRNAEMRNLRIADVDCERQMVHVRNGKGKKDRYVPTGKLLSNAVAEYVQTNLSDEYLFGSNRKHKASGERYSAKGLQWIIKQAANNSGLRKNISVHTLRHTYATHLLEHGLDIMTIRDLLGHADIGNTLIYLHVAQNNRKSAFSPLDKIYEPARPHPFTCPYATGLEP